MGDGVAVAKPKGTDEPTTPTSFPATPPGPTGTDISTWLLNAASKNAEAMGRVDANVASLRAQMDRVEAKLDVVAAEVRGHGNWIHTLKYVLSGIGVLLGWAIVYAVFPWVKSRLR